MRTLRLQVRFLLPLLAALVAAAYLSQPVMDRMTLNWFSRDLSLRGALVADALSDSIERELQDAPRQTGHLQSVFDRTVRDERLVAVALCTPDNVMVRASSGFPPELGCEAARTLSSAKVPQWRAPSGSVHVGWHSVSSDSASDVGGLVLLHDLSFIERRSRDTQWHLLGLITALGVVIALITMAVAQLSWRGWVAGAQALLRGEGLIKPMADGSAGAPELAALAGDLRTRLRDLEDEYRRSLGPEDAEWTAERLRSLLQRQLRGDDVIVVSNREPYIHDQLDGELVVRRPASGLVTALEPVMRACSGTWIAHGSGSADRQAVDREDRVAVPPEDPRYTLRRVWLTQEEEQGYYYGFANEGLWPLCHVAHVRPVFRESDWQAYRRVNERFAEIFTTQLLSFMDTTDIREAVRKLSDYTRRYTDLMQELAARWKVHLIGGSHPTLRDDGRLMNTAYYFTPGGAVHEQDKIHRTRWERERWNTDAGSQLRLFDTPFGKIAILVCYDIEFPELARKVCEAGADILFVPSCTDDRQGFLRVRYCCHARAIENQVFVVHTSTVGNLPVEGLGLHYGQAAIITPSDFAFARDGIAAEGTANIEQIVVADVDLDDLQSSRIKGTTIPLHDKRRDVYAHAVEIVTGC